MKLAHDVHGPEGAPAVVLLGSLGATRGMWAPQIRVLGDHFRIIAADLRGHGESPAPEGPYTMEELAGDVVELLDDLRVDAAHVAGLSLGGAVAQTLALTHPDRVRSLTLLSTAPKFGEEQAWLDKAELVAKEGTGALAETVVGNWFTDACFARTPELPATYADGIRATDDAGYAGCCRAIAGFDSREALAGVEERIRLATLVVAGEQDTSTAVDVVRGIHERMDGSRMTTISPAKHLVTVEQADLANAVLAAHWSAH
ncbi:alpha/beta fold hydrolase [Corynebacterium sp. 335C]